MIWIPLIVSQGFFGFVLTNFVLRAKLDFLIELFIGIPLGFASSTVIFYYLSTFFAISTLHVILHIVLLLFISFVLFKLHPFPKFITPNNSIRIFLAVSFIFTILIVPPIYFVPNAQFSKGSFNEFYEEFTLINSFLKGVNSGFTNPFKIRHPFCYKCIARSHWVTPLHSAMMIEGFASMRVAITIPSMIFLFQFCFLYLVYAKSILKSDLFAILALFSFFFAGGLGFIRWFWRDQRLDRSLDFVNNLKDKQTLWLHPIIQYLLGFRPSLLSISLIISILHLFDEINMFNKNKSTPDKYQKMFICILAGAIFGLTVPNQIEATIGFIIYSFLFFLFNCFNFSKNKVELTDPVFFFGAFFVFALMSDFFNLIPRKTSAKLLSFNYYWNSYTKNGIFFGGIVVWFESLGTFAIITLVVFWFFIFEDYKFSMSFPNNVIVNFKMIKFYLPSFITFVFLNVVIINSNERNNIFAFYPVWMPFASIIFVYTLNCIWNLAKTDEIKGLLITWCSFFFIMATASAVLGFYRLKNQTITPFTNDMENIAEWISIQTNKKALFGGCGVDHEKIISALAGKMVVMANTDNNNNNYFVNLMRSGHKPWAEAVKAYDELLRNPNSPDLLPRLMYSVYSSSDIRYKPKTIISIENKNITNWKKVHAFGSFTVVERINVAKK